tara:strand:+ start:4812 stop:4937 length:126 start_codon:yes stop_codon:yes gene_type:complete
MRRVISDDAFEEAIKDKRVKEKLLRQMLFVLGIEIEGEEEE